MSNFVKYPQIQTVPKKCVSKPNHAARLLQPSYDRLERIDGKKHFNRGSIFSQCVLCFELVVVDFFCQRSKGHHLITCLSQPHVPATSVATENTWFANRHFQLWTTWKCNVKLVAHIFSYESSYLSKVHPAYRPKTEACDVVLRPVDSNQMRLTACWPNRTK